MSYVLLRAWIYINLMIVHAQGSTGTSRMALYWPAHLPHKLPKKFKDDGFGLLDELEESGRFIELPCSESGSYGIRLIVDEDLPDAIRDSYNRARTIPQVDVLGATRFGGLECLLENTTEVGSGFSQGKAHEFTVEVGLYEAEIFICRMRDEQKEAELLSRTGYSKWLIEVNDFVMGCGILFLVVASITLKLWFVVPTWLWMSATCFVLFAVLCAQVPVLKKINQTREAIDNEFPHYLVTMRSKR